jgi:hypothetical protein
MDAYARSSVSDWGNLVVVADVAAEDSVLKLIDGRNSNQQSWICGSGFLDRTGCSVDSVARDPENNWVLYGNTTGGLTCNFDDDVYLTTLPVHHYLAQKTPPGCTLRLDMVLLLVVAVSNLLQVLCIALTLFCMGHEPLITIADMIDSFLRRPDPTTSGMCFLDARQVPNWRSNRTSAAVFAPWKPRRHSWSSAVTKKRWWICSTLYVPISRLLVSRF